MKREREVEDREDKAADEVWAVDDGNVAVARLRSEPLPLDYRQSIRHAFGMYPVDPNAPSGASVATRSPSWTIHIRAAPAPAPAPATRSPSVFISPSPSATTSSSEATIRTGPVPATIPPPPPPPPSPPQRPLLLSSSPPANPP
ncbi:hypothetical protein MMC14_004858 [Varicellaria rhodocarpa]|nr:hypothetical protein [Varicellaria rhodocarpa]